MAKASRKSGRSNQPKSHRKQGRTTRPSAKDRPAPKDSQAPRDSPASKDRSSSKTRRTAKEHPTPKTRRAPKTSPPAEPGLSTEEKILRAAKKLFTKQGFAAVRTRDIAKEAGINLALLNYYYRSKEKLFDIVMMENFRQFIRGISVNLTDDSTPLPEKVRKVTTAYIDFLIANPDLPLFILNELRGNPSELAEKLHQEIGPARQHMIDQLTAAAKEGRLPPLHPFHFIANLVGLTVFPFVARPLLQRITGISDPQFITFMEERKELVPRWINAIMNTNMTTNSKK